MDRNPKVEIPLPLDSQMARIESNSPPNLPSLSSFWTNHTMKFLHRSNSRGNSSKLDETLVMNNADSLLWKCMFHWRPKIL
jgi:hypothetical protein